MSPDRSSDLFEAASALVFRLEEGAADGRLPAILNLGPLAPEHPLYGVWSAMERVATLSRERQP